MVNLGLGQVLPEVDQLGVDDFREHLLVVGVEACLLESDAGPEEGFVGGGVREQDLLLQLSQQRLSAYVDLRLLDLLVHQVLELLRESLNQVLITCLFFLKGFNSLSCLNLLSSSVSSLMGCLSPCCLCSYFFSRGFLIILVSRNLLLRISMTLLRITLLFSEVVLDCTVGSSTSKA